MTSGEDIVATNRRAPETVYLELFALTLMISSALVRAYVHVSGHTVEYGVVKTGAVRIGRNVTIGLGSVIQIGADIGPGCQVGALSLVPKHTTLDASAVYVGIPVRRIA